MRLTEKAPKPYVEGTYQAKGRDLLTKTYQQMMMNKLGQLEDIEEELGIDLKTILFALLQDKIYFYSNKTNRVEYKSPTARSLKAKTIIFGFDETIVELKDYGKTWALTKEELL